MSGSTTSRTRSWGAVALALLLAAAASADGRIEAVVENLLSGELERMEDAEQELLNLGIASVPALKGALGRADLPPAGREEVDRMLRAILTELILAYQNESRDAVTVFEASDLPEAESLGVDAGRPSHWPSLVDESFSEARREILDLGLLAAESILDPKIWAGSGLQELQADLFSEIGQSFLLEIVGEEGRQSAGDELQCLGPLAAPVLLLEDQASEALRPWFAETRAALVSRYLAWLDSADPAERELARDFLFRLDELAIPELERRRDYLGTRLLVRIRFGVSDALFLKIGHVFLGYDRLEVKDRRELIDAVARLGGVDAIPCLRKLIDHEPEMSLRLLAAQGLARLGDETAIAFIEQVGMAELLQIPQATAAIYMDSGIKYLKVGKYAKAVAEFEKILAFDPENEVAHYNLACAYSLWNRLDEAVEHLKQSVEYGYDDLEHMREDTDLDNIRHTEGYLEVERLLEEKARE